MTMNPRIRTLLAALALVPLSACLGDPAEPEVIIDPLEPVVLNAVSVDGQALPATIHLQGQPESEHQLTRAVFTLKAPDSLRVMLFMRQSTMNGTTTMHVDTLHAHAYTQGETLIIAPMGAHPFNLDERVNIGTDGSIILTVKQLPGAAGTAPLLAAPMALLFRY